ncbi:hypothetical protein BDN72DRAFT_905400 [Pluteus cervinus]|uniref:Uncharacterized protein n=1 Tax=Pluteus cervinus TaxID=181527 RepID=A0ACD3A298_9AGAR|nr:hypothetical protein BDN72DRAFT_905400 [Pluteus cervinus]
MPPTFPAEIVHEFMLRVNEDRERIDTLLSCSLVSQIWCALARPYLYTQVVLNVEHGRVQKATAFTSTLTKFPHFRTYIHRLLLVVPYTPSDSSVSVMAALGDLASLQSLRIRPIVVYDMADDDKLQKHLPPLLSSKSLTFLELSDIQHFQIDLLRLCSSLQTLALRRVEYSLTPTSGAESETTGYWAEGWPALKSLILSTEEDGQSKMLSVFRSPRSPVDLSQLETFIGLDQCDTTKAYQDHCKFISHVSRTLKTVHIDPPSSYLREGVQAPHLPLELHKLQSISNMTLSIVQQPHRQRNALPWLISVLSGLPDPGTLRNLTLLCDLEDHSGNDFTFHAQGWSELDALLPRFHHLRRVHLKCYDERDAKAATELVSWLHSQLPILVNKGLLSVEHFSGM